MAKKINLNGVKDFLFNHGEKVALGTCGFLALFFGVTGLMAALNAGKSPESGKPWTTEMDQRHNEIGQGLKSADIPKLPPETIEMLQPKRYDWAMVKTDYLPQPYINIGESADNKRQNPRALAIRSGPKGSHLEPVPALFYTYETLLTESKVKILVAAGAGGGNGAAFAQPKKGMAAQGAGAAGNTQFLKAGEPRRLIVGHAVFPMKDQVLEFQRALKYASQKEMFDAPREDLPSPLGFDLYKFEILPNGQYAKKEPEVLLLWDPSTKTATLSPKLKKFLSVAMFDEKDAAALEPYIFSGLTMPLPQLAYGNYPPVVLDGGIQSNFEEEGKEPGMRPKGPGNERQKGGNLPGFGPGKQGPGKQPAMEKEGQKADVNFSVSFMTRKELQAGGPAEQALASRLFDSDFNVYHALGLKQATPGEADGPNAKPVFMPRGPGGAGGAGVQTDRFGDAWDIKTGEVGPDGKLIDNPQPKQPPMKIVMPKRNGPGLGAADPQAGPLFPNWDRDAVVRFIDIDVEPGKTYQYAIRIHLKNPNFGAAKIPVVAYVGLTQVEELVSEPVYTERITIPHDYYLYAIDQQLLDEGRAPIAEAKVKDATTFQIHQWTTKPVDQDLHIRYPIGDCAIAERILVHKGDRIGPAAVVQVPYWDERADAFKVPTKKHPGSYKPGLQFDMAPPPVDNAGAGIVGDSGFPVLIDFIGGKRKVALNSNVDEEVAVDALIAGVDGKLHVLNSRDASDVATAAGRERYDRLMRARERVAEASGRAMPNGPGMPKKGGLPGVNND